MSSSSTSTAESWRQNRSPSGKRVKHLGQTFTRLLSEARGQEQREEAVVVELLPLLRLHVQERELEAEVELGVRRELDARRRGDLQLVREVEVDHLELREQHHRQRGDRVGRDAERR